MSVGESECGHSVFYGITNKLFFLTQKLWATAKKRFQIRKLIENTLIKKKK